MSCLANFGFILLMIGIIIFVVTIGAQVMSAFSKPRVTRVRKRRKKKTRNELLDGL